MSRVRLLVLAGFGFLAAALPAEARLDNPLLAVETAAVERGRTVITGTTVVAGTTVSIAGTGFSTKSDARRGFRFELAWLPPTCIAQLTVGSQVHPAVVANCAPARASKFEGFGADGAQIKGGSWLFVAGGKPTNLVAGEAIAFNASFVPFPNSNSVVYPDIPGDKFPLPPELKRRPFEVTACLKPTNGLPLVLSNPGYQTTSGYAYPDINHLVASIDQLIVVGKSGSYFVGLCGRSDGGPGVTVHDLNGWWATLN